VPTKKAIAKKPRTRRVVDHVARLLCPKRDPVPLSLATLDRLDELAKPTPTELDCSICAGVGVPKIDGTNRRICVVCYLALRDVPRPQRKALLHNHEDYMWYRLPYFAQYLVSDNRMNLETNILEKIAG
jgi:hypothetical protein